MEVINSANSQESCRNSDESDGSCVIIEKEPTIIEIVNTQSTEEESKDVNGEEGDIQSEFEVLDQTFGSDIITINDSQESSCQVVTPVKKSNKSSKSSEKFLVDIKFSNKKTYFSLHEEFIEVIQKCFKKKLDDLNIIDDAANNRVSVAEKLVKKSDTFLIDTTPTVDLTSIESSPRFTSLSKSVLTRERLQTEDDEDMKKSTPSAHACFNCGKSSHSLRDCPEPRNLSKIRQARNNFNRKELRYVDDENEFSKFTPGKLSKDLKEALGVTSNQVPLHIYKMRQFGYPPAWLEEAKVYNSGLSLFIEKDKVQSHGDEESRQFKFDVQKIHDFPGFNVAPEPPFVDRHRLLNLPSMQERDSKEVFIQSLGDVVVNGYKKRKLKDIGLMREPNSQTDQAEADMEIGHSDSENEETLPPGCESPDEEGQISNDLPSSPTVDELQSARNELLAQLNSPYPDTQSKSLIEETILENSVNENLDNSSREDSTLKYGHVETTLFGATVLPSFSPFDNLPAGDNFKEGVSDVIAFENLAESTGKYEKMKGLISKVRVFVKENKED